MTPVPKPQRRIVNREVGAAKIVREARCRVCGSRDALQRHHLVPRSLGGDDLEMNLVPLCGFGARDCHGQFERGIYRPIYGAVIRGTMRPEEVAYVRGKKGEDFLDRYYPVEPPPGPVLERLVAEGALGVWGANRAFLRTRGASMRARRIEARPVT